ncbi:helix-turn-helix domain-containing protein [Halioxenophilus aromaticivorans]|uniref:Transcriptional regulator FtrA n=1 Tax=Halioxenophilus aromaticivorans TaxID=1306992 RepID=A0AAV3U0Q3_9ALTE
MPIHSPIQYAPEECSQQTAYNKRVGILASHNGALFELGSAVELFGLARPEFDNWYHCQVISLASSPLNYTAGVGIHAHTVSDFSGYDLIVVPHWSTAEKPHHNSPAHRHLKAAAAAGCQIISFCSGAFLLAECGLLDGKKATTHWRFSERFQQRFGQVQFAKDVLYVFDGQIGCSAGSAAGLDLGLEVIRQDHGYQIANQVARRLVISAQRQGGQSQFVETPMQKTPSKFSATLDWALANLDRDIDIDRLAEKANMSRRTFDRKFRASFQLSANQWLIMQRLNMAKQRLEESNLPLDRIAEQTGFNNAITLRHHFNKILGISPSGYRAQFAKTQ